MKKIMIYDSNSSAHIGNYVEFIIDYLINISDSFSESTFEFLINDKVLKNLKENSIYFLNQNYNNFNINVIETDSQKAFESTTNILARMFLEKTYLEDYCVENGIDKIFFLQIDAYQLMIGMWGFSKFKHIIISGIIFQPFIQQPIEQNFNGIVNRLRKRFQLWLMLKHPNINPIFILNDKHGVDKLNLVYNIKIFEYLPDPIKSRKFDKIDVRNKYGVDNSKKILLFIGGVQRRKNVVSIIKAISDLSPNQKNEVCLMILGKCEDDNLLNEITSELLKEKTCQIIFDNSFVYNNLLESAIVDSDVVFVIYSDFYCSSAVLVNVAKHNKYIIASNVGVIGNITRQYNLGKTVNPNSVPDITKAIKNFIEINQVKECGTVNNSSFINSHDYLKFAEQIVLLK